MGDKRADIEAQVADSMQRILDGYRSGVQIQGIAIKQADPPDAVNDAFKQVTAAQQDAQSYINQARAYALQLTAKSQGEATSFDKVYEQYKLAPDVTRRRMYYETMEQVLSKVDKTIIEAPGVTPYLPLPQVQKTVRGAGTMIDYVRRHPILTAVLAVLVLSLVLSSFPIVPETKQAVVVRFGKPIRILNRYKPGPADRRARRGHHLPAPVRRPDRVDRQARARCRHAAPAGPVDRPAAARGRRFRPLPDRRPAAHVHSRAAASSSCRSS